MKLERINAYLEKLRFEELMIYPLASIAGLVLLAALAAGIYQESIAIIFFLLLILGFVLWAMHRGPQEGAGQVLVMLLEIILVLIPLNLLGPGGRAILSILLGTICLAMALLVLTGRYK